MIRMAEMAALVGICVCGSACDRAANMAEQPHLKPLERSAFFADGASERPVPDGTVDRNGIVYGPTTSPAPPPKPEMTMPLLARGQTAFNISCSPCHSRDGTGNGLIVQRGYPAPPSLHEPRLRRVEDDHILRVIVNGQGKMPSYADQVPPSDRWAVVAYIRALQLSRHAPVDLLSEAVRKQLPDPVSKADGPTVPEEQ